MHVRLIQKKTIISNEFECVSVYVTKDDAKNSSNNQFYTHDPQNLVLIQWEFLLYKDTQMYDSS